MSIKNNIKIAEEVLRIRYSQLIINENYKSKAFKIPIHMALGHEAIAIAVKTVMQEDDCLALTHRNVHYNLAKAGLLKPEIDEYLLKEGGLASGRLGSMNLANTDEGVIYTSSILGNNLGVASGLALASKVKGDGVTIVITGDGAMEEGSFYETLLFLKSNDLSTIIIVENNEWSLATTISQRRCKIDLEKYTSALGIQYERLKGNDVYGYIEKIGQVRTVALADKTPVLVEVELTTLGDWRLKTDKFPDGKFINYHCGPAPTVDLELHLVIDESDKDPIFVLKNHFDENEFEGIANRVLMDLKEQLK